MRLQALDAYLDRDARAPLAVAFSGGGDSLALLLAVKAWADAARRPVIALTVDHRLQPAGADWARWCAALAARLGVEHRTLVWEGDKPTTGLAAAARAARHRLVAEAARAAGAHVILMGHTADDVIEARLMRAADGVPSDPKLWSPSPSWPDGRGLFILRPMLDLRRADIRAALTAIGETWIDDPANSDQRSARARARVMVSEVPERGRPVHPFMFADRQERTGRPRSEGGGEIRFNVESLGAEPEARHILAASLLCASGTSDPPRGARLDRLLERILARTAFTASLAGARVESDGGRVLIVREIGELKRAGTPAVDLPPDQPMVWDGRFEITTRRAGLRVRPLEGLARRLPESQQSMLRAMAAAVRRALPVVVDAEGEITCPILAPDPSIEIKSLVGGRLAAALGAIESEAMLERRGESGGNTLNGGLERDEASS